MHVNHLETCDGVWSSLADGGRALLQPLGRSAEAPVLAVFDGLSPRSRELRFLTGVPRLTKHMLAVLTEVDDCQHVAWVALVDGHPSGIARYVRVSDDTAELAFEVVDAQHRRGLGLLLLDTVATLAMANGVRRVTATVHPENHASVQLLRRYGLVLHLDHGLLEGEAALRLPDPPRVDRAAVVDLALRRAASRGRTQPCGASVA
jgi:GNAT superfamily N-acetyltransferase